MSFCKRNNTVGSGERRRKRRRTGAEAGGGEGGVGGVIQGDQNALRQPETFYQEQNSAVPLVSVIGRSQSYSGHSRH